MRALGIGLTVVALAACSSTTAPAPAPSSSAASTSAAATSASPSESATPTPTTTPTPTPTAEPTWPLTGLPLTGPDTSRATLPALMVKVDNVGSAVPQAGLNEADLVVEEPVEGGLTRFVAVFQSRDPGTVGPIRSARPIDADISRMLGGGGMLLFSGASRFEIRPVKARSNAVLISDDDNTAPGTFFHGDRGGDHNLFAHAGRTWPWAQANAADRIHPPQVPFAFTEATPNGASKATSAQLRFEDNQVGWEWDGQHWLRSQHGSDHNTMDDGRVQADTVVIVSVATTIDPTLHDVLGTPTPVVDFHFGGPAWVLRDGTVTEGRWSRPSMDSPLVLTDASGQPMGVKPGRTWLEILPRPAKPTISWAP